MHGQQNIKIMCICWYIQIIFIPTVFNSVTLHLNPWNQNREQSV